MQCRSQNCNWSPGDVRKTEKRKMSASVGHVRHRDRMAKDGLVHRVRTKSVSDIMQTLNNSGCLLYFKHLLHCYLDMVKCVMLLDRPLFVLFLF